MPVNAGDWRHATVVGERAGRPWLLCATSSRRCAFGAQPQSRESVGWRTLRCSMRESCAAILHSHPARLRVGLGAAHGERWLSTWQPRSRSSAVKSKKLFPGKLMPHSRACPATGSDRGKRDPTLFVMRLSGRALRNGARLTAVDTPFAGRQMQMLLGHTCRQCLEEQRQGRRQVSCHQAASECDLEPSGHQ